MYYFDRYNLNWLTWFHFIFLEGGLLIILKDCMFFLSLFLVVARMSISTTSFIKQLFSGIFCFGNLNAFLWSMIWKASLGLELIKTFLLQFFLNKFFYVLSCFVLLVTPCLIKAVQPCMEWIPILKKAHLPIGRCAICRYTVGYQDVSVGCGMPYFDQVMR